MDTANLRIAQAAPARDLPEYAIPERRIRRARYVPRGRALHILDFENLCTGPRSITERRDQVARSYHRLAAVTPGDHVVIGTNPNNLLPSSGAFPGCRFVAEHGPDGADKALLKVLEDIDWVAHRFDRVVIGSGDHCFVPVVVRLGRRGILVAVVAQERCISGDLARAATVTLRLRDFPVGPRKGETGSTSWGARF